MKKFKYAFVVGRFQPLHLGHEQLITVALSKAEKVIIFLGSSQESGTKKNPYSVIERQHFFYSAFKEHIDRFVFVGLPDTEGDYSWIMSIIDKLDSIAGQASLCNVCFDKDVDTTQSNRLLKSLWDSTRITVTPTYPNLSATDIRRIVIEDKVCPKQLIGTHLSKRAAQAVKEIGKMHNDKSI